MQTITDNVVMVVEYCCSCGTPFGIQHTKQLHLKRTGQTFYCPNGHAQVYTKPVEEKLKEAVENARWWKEHAEATATELQQTRSNLTVARRNLTRTKNRIAKGVCPCCNRQFVNLHRHMAGQHPEYPIEE